MFNRIAFLLALAAGPAAAEDTSQGVPEILVIGRSPLLGTGVDADKLPNATRTLRGQSLAEHGQPSLTGALSDQVGSAGLSDTSGNAERPDFTFRGFTASPLEGTPQGVAVYQDGVRLNEAFGDTVNWDLVPTFAIDRVDLTSTNPVYGFNALGGALALEMKNGFGVSGVEGGVSGGTFGRKGVDLQYGEAFGKLGVYVGAAALNDDGWRRRMPSKTRNAYADVGYGKTLDQIHLSVTGADNALTGAGPTPVDLLTHDRRAGFSYPQEVRNQLTLVGLRGTTALTNTLSLQGSAYFRDFIQKLRDGNPTSVQPCLAPLDPTTMCSTDDATNAQTPVADQNGRAVPTAAGGDNPGQIDGATTATKSTGGGVQMTLTSPLFGLANHLVGGAAVDQGRTKFRTTSELGAFDGDRTVRGSGLEIAGGSVNPIALDATNTYTGVYVSDTLDLTDALSATLSARHNQARIQMDDQLRDELNGTHDYQRLNPAAGLAYKIQPGFTVYGGYAESNRAPTAAELSCADPAASCSLAGFFVQDPDLKQVVAKTAETGVRGSLRTAGAGRIQWSAGVFRTDNTDDIIQVSSVAAGKGYFRNAGTTRRQGAELSFAFQDRLWHADAEYAYTDATYRTALSLNSPNNPAADADGHLRVTPGNHLPGIPRQRLKLGLDHAILATWSVGSVVNAAGSQYLRGDESNRTAQLGAYAVVNLHTTYKATDSVHLWASVENLFDQRYETFGTFTDGSGVPVAADQGGPIGKTRTVTPAAPRGIYAGVRCTL